MEIYITASSALLTFKTVSPDATDPPFVTIFTFILNCTLPFTVSKSFVVPDIINSSFPAVDTSVFDGLSRVAEKLTDPGLSAEIREIITWSGKEAKTCVL